MKNLTTLIAILFMASCSKESLETTSPHDTTTPVEAQFTASSITRMSSNDWESGDKIGITMFEKSSTTTLATGDYANVPYTVVATNTEGNDFATDGDFAADSEVIYYPADGSSVDFNAYYPYNATVTDNTTIAVDVSAASSPQVFKNIDIIAAKVSNMSKYSTSTVSFTDNNAFTHQLSKLTMNVVAGDNVSTLTDLSVVIKGQYNTAKYNIYTQQIDLTDATKGTDITAVTAVATGTTPTTATSEAILIPTSSAITGSTIVFTIGSGTKAASYTLKTDSFTFTKGTEHIYTITLRDTGASITASTISDWTKNTTSGTIYAE